MSCKAWGSRSPDLTLGLLIPWGWRSCSGSSASRQEGSQVFRPFLCRYEQPAFAVPLTASQQTYPPVITFAHSLPDSLFILALRAHADVVEQSCLRAEFSKLSKIVLTCLTSSRCVSQGSPTTQAASCSSNNTCPGASS